MAGDWIKFQIDTPDKPEVLAIANRLNIDPDAVVGKLIRVWSWFDKHTIDGNAQSVTFSFLDRLTCVTGFAEQMQFVGWLEQNGSVLTMTNFVYHNGKSAKSRALGKDRQDKHRNNNAKSNAISNASTVTKSLPEKRREENINTYTDDFELFWKLYSKPVGKVNAFKEWNKLKPNAELIKLITEKAKAQVIAIPETKFRKDAERWIRDRRWEDEITAKPTNDIFSPQRTTQ